MWEVFSRGGKPYSDLPTIRDVAHAVSVEKRTLPRPSAIPCNDAVWNLMNSCFRWASEERPSFAQLQARIQELETAPAEETSAASVEYANIMR